LGVDEDQLQCDDDPDPEGQEEYDDDPDPEGQEEAVEIIEYSTPESGTWTREDLYRFLQLGGPL